MVRAHGQPFRSGKAIGSETYFNAHWGEGRVYRRLDARVRISPDPGGITDLSQGVAPATPGKACSQTDPGGGRRFAGA